MACASSKPADERAVSSRSDCISQPSIRGYTVLDESNLLVTTSGRRKYHVVLQRRAYGLRSSWGIGFKGPTTGRICAAFGEVFFDGHYDNASVRIAAIRALDSEDEEDLLIQFGKKKPEIEHTPAPQEVTGAEVEELDPAADD
ncbi:MAG: hypothetical protein KJO95_04655 [Gammaproteobacteria bacterium]|nr:hypothetical protein [Gammaproteobacteria bacterium]MBU2677422.1 hypothetical protein [Gammaproteobacteria bacterium]NNC56272.1 hypothetical protein [Woeseiaceae bacterium]NNL51154.1 hypothetical protein [Woeseiaceae bacterium]